MAPHSGASVVSIQRVQQIAQEENATLTLCEVQVIGESVSQNPYTTVS